MKSSFVCPPRAATLFSCISIFILAMIFTITLGTGRGYNKVYEGVGAKGILAVFEGDVACPYISLVPETFRQKILNLPHVVDVASEVRQRYAYGHNKNLTLTAMDPAKLTAFKSFKIDPTGFAQFKDSANGALVGRKIFNMFNWQVGQQVTAQGLVFKIAGVFDQPLSVYESMVFLHKDYLQQLTAKTGFATSLLVKTDLDDKNEQKKVMQSVEAIFKDYPSRVICRYEDDLWQSIKASQGNLGDILQALGLLLGLLLSILTINNFILITKRERESGAINPGKTLLICALSGAFAVPVSYLVTLTHPYVGTDMFHPPIYIDGNVALTALVVAVLSACLARVCALPFTRPYRASATPWAGGWFIAGALCLCGMILVVATSHTLGTSLKSLIMNQGTENNMILVDAGADTPMFSSLTSQVYEFARTVPGVVHKDGAPMATQCLQVAGLVNGYFTNVRGVDDMYYPMYDQYRIIKGHKPQNKNEIMIGTLLSEKINQPLDIGGTITFEGGQWRITGLFEDHLTVMGSGIVARLSDLKQATHRTHISFVTIRAKDHASMVPMADYIKKTFDALLMENPEMPGILADSEVEYYLHESEALNPLILFFNLVSALYILVGAVIMYNIIDSAIKTFTPAGPRWVVCRGWPGSIFMTSFILILAMAICGTGAATLFTLLVARVSINFMMMTLFLEISAKTILVAGGVAAIAALFPAMAAFKRAFPTITETGTETEQKLTAAV